MTSLLPAPQARLARPGQGLLPGRSSAPASAPLSKGRPAVERDGCAGGRGKKDTFPIPFTSRYQLLPKRRLGRGSAGTARPEPQSCSSEPHPRLFCPAQPWLRTAGAAPHLRGPARPHLHGGRRGRGGREGRSRCPGTPRAAGTEGGRTPGRTGSAGCSRPGGRPDGAGGGRGGVGPGSEP